MADRGSHYASSGEENDSLSNSSSSNKFANDGSFMEMFKKKMEEENRKKQSQESRTSPTKVDSKSDSGNPSQKHSNFPSTSSTLSAGQNINKDSSSVPKKSSLLSFVRVVMIYNIFTFPNLNEGFNLNTNQYQCSLRAIEFE